MKLGCFALIQPFTDMKRQFELIREMGFEFADLTDNHNGGMLESNTVSRLPLVSTVIPTKFAKCCALRILH